MTATIWNPQGSTVVQANAAGLVKEEVVITSAGQTVVLINTFAYTPNTGSLLVIKNDRPLERIADYTETGTGQFTLTVPAAVGDRLMVVGFVGTTGIVAADTVLRADLFGSAGATLSRYLSPATAAALGTLADRIHVIDAIADFQWDPTFTFDRTNRIEDFFNALTNNCIGVIPPGSYKYTPTLGLGTGVGYLNMENLSNCHIFGYGANIVNSFVVTVAPATQNELYGIQMYECVGCSIRGTTFDGNRDKTFGTNADGNEFYSAYAMIGCLNCSYIDIVGVNCQGDGLSNNRVNGNTGFNYNCSIVGNCTFGGNRRNEMSIGGDYGTYIGGGIKLLGSNDAHRTSPMAGIDIEWEHATIGPVNNDIRLIIDGVYATGTMPGAAIYIPNSSGISVSNFNAEGVITGCTIDNTHTGNYETQDITFGQGVKFRTTYGINIVGGANIVANGVVLKCSYPAIVNSPLSSNPYKWCATFTGCRFEGESVFSIAVLQGRTRFTNNLCYNSSSIIGGFEYLALFRPECDIMGNTWFRDGNIGAPTNGIVISNSASVFEGNNIFSVGAITHRVCWGESSVPAYPCARTNYYNGHLIEDLMTTQEVNSQLITMGSATPFIFYMPRNSEIIDIGYTLQDIGAGGAPSHLSIGTVTNPNAYINLHAVTDTLYDGLFVNITGSLVTPNTPNGQAVVIKPTPAANNPPIALAATVRYNRAQLYTSAVTFTV